MLCDFNHTHGRHLDERGDTRSSTIGVEMADGNVLEQTDDAELLRMWRSGEPEGQRASRVLYHRYKQLVTRFFLSKGGSGDPADLVAQTFAELFRRNDALVEVESFRGLLMTIAVRVFYAHLRKRTKRCREEVDFSELCLSRLCEPSPSSGVHRRHALERLSEALRDIPVESQLLIELKYFAQLSDRDVAHALQIPCSTLPSRHRRALRELRSAASLG